MKTPRRTLGLVSGLLAWAGPSVVAVDPPPAAAGAGQETLTTADGARLTGTLGGDARTGYRFLADGGGKAVPLEPKMTVRFAGQAPPPVAGLPNFRVELGLNQRIWGRLGRLDGHALKVHDVAGNRSLTIARDGVRAVVQRPGESLVLRDGFEALDEGRWASVGDPEVTDDVRAEGARSLKLPAGGTSLTHKLAEPVGSGRLDVAFHDAGGFATGQQWFVDLTFKAPAGRQTVRAVLGWVEESYAVESPAGPALAVQRLGRKPGWHRLGLRFGPESSEVSVDGDELAHGKGVDGPLVEIRLASYATGQSPVPPDLAGVFDDLRLVRFDEPAGGFEVDATQDEVRLSSGDQLFGQVVGASEGSVSVSLDGKDLALPWGEVAGLYLRREAGPGAPVEGWLVRVDWRSGPGTDARELNQVEGALAAVTPTALGVATPYAGLLEIPRERVTTLHVLGRGRRIVIDPDAHHLGDEVTTKPPLLDPPQPEGGALERAFDLADVPGAPAFLVLDVVQVAGEAGDLPFSSLIQKGQLKTNVKMNGEPFDYLNRYVHDRNETPARVRLPVPAGLLKRGRNVVRFEQTGTENDPNYLDDLGLLGVALEFDDGDGAGAPR